MWKLIPALFLMGCAKKLSLRDAKTYGTEVEFIDRIVWQQNSSLNGLIASHCTCKVDDFDGPQWSSTECLEAAETSAVVEARWKWHSEMMKYLGGLSEKQPPKDVPAIPTPKEICTRWGGE